MTTASPRKGKGKVPTTAHLKVLHKGNGKVLLEQVQVTDDMNGLALKKTIATTLKRPVSVARQRLTLPVKTEKEKAIVVQDDELVLTSHGLQTGDVIFLKDLGPQIGYQTVFVIEYLGPMLIHAFFYHFGYLLYGVPSFTPTSLQTLAYGLVMTHYAKRELETLFVHRFSHATMPFRNLFKNCSHYWFTGGVCMAYPLFHPGYQQPSYLTPTLVRTLVALFCLCQCFNLHAHVTLRRLRPAGTRVRKIPYGGFFNLVSCPNYFFEILAWTLFSVLTGHWMCWLFTVLGAGQMWVWAGQKHKAYKRDFPDYPKRHVLVPFLA